MVERRHRRSDRPEKAVQLYLEAVSAREGVPALALATAEGRLVAGTGALDVEWMGTLGALSKRTRLDWDGRRLFVQRLAVNDVPLYLTSADRPVRTDAPATIQRILAA